MKRNNFLAILSIFILALGITAYSLVSNTSEVVGYSSANNASPLNVSCAVSNRKVSTGEEITFSVNYSGGKKNVNDYTFEWFGISGSDKEVVSSFDKAGKYNISVKVSQSGYGSSIDTCSIITVEGEDIVDESVDIDENNDEIENEDADEDIDVEITQEEGFKEISKIVKDYEEAQKNKVVKLEVTQEEYREQAKELIDLLLELLEQIITLIENVTSQIDLEKLLIAKDRLTNSINELGTIVESE